MYLSGVAIPFGIPQQQALSVLPVFGPQDLFGRTSIYHLYPHASSSVMGDTSPLYILFTIDIYHWYHFISSYTNMYIYHLLIFTIYLQFIYHLFTIYLPFIYMFYLLLVNSPKFIPQITCSDLRCSLPVWFPPVREHNSSFTMVLVI